LGGLGSHGGKFQNYKREREREKERESARARDSSSEREEETVTRVEEKTRLQGVSQETGNERSRETGKPGNTECSKNKHTNTDVGVYLRVVLPRTRDADTQRHGESARARRAYVVKRPPPRHNDMKGELAGGSHEIAAETCARSSLSEGIFSREQLGVPQRIGTKKWRKSKASFLTSSQTATIDDHMVGAPAKAGHLPTRTQHHHHRTCIARSSAE
jgi:hypothetical protein